MKRGNHTLTAILILAFFTMFFIANDAFAGFHGINERNYAYGAQTIIQSSYLKVEGINSIILNEEPSSEAFFYIQDFNHSWQINESTLYSANRTSERFAVICLTEGNKYNQSYIEGIIVSSGLNIQNTKEFCLSISVINIILYSKTSIMLYEVSGWIIPLNS